ncbi:MAG: hypothetical protein GWP05_07590 [Anaerolineaceae bacterium]|nr:hypothetical protein [Anaerolineaceae bacterium]
MTNTLGQLLAAALLVALSAPLAQAEIHYVSPDGSPEGQGRPDSPLDLATVLSAKTSPAAPGDTIALGGGTYRGMFNCNISGTRQRPITIRGIPGRRATIDGGGFRKAALTVRGAWTIWRDLELTNSDLRRNSRRTTSWPGDLRRMAGMMVTGDNVRLLNLVVHDAGNGLELRSRAADTEVYGCIIYYNGWDSPVGGFGHGIDVQNGKGAKHIVDNILFNNFACGLHAASRMAPVSNLHIEGNIAFDNGVLAHGQRRRRNMLIGSLSRPAEGDRRQGQLSASHRQRRDQRADRPPERERRPGLHGQLRCRGVADTQLQVARGHRQHVYLQSDDGSPLAAQGRRLRGLHLAAEQLLLRRGSVVSTGHIPPTAGLGDRVRRLAQDHQTRRRQPLQRQPADRPQGGGAAEPLRAGPRTRGRLQLGPQREGGG